MPERPRRETVDLSRYPDLVLIYLGMRVNTITGIKPLLGFGPRISARKRAGLVGESSRAVPIGEEELYYR